MPCLEVVSKGMLEAGWLESVRSIWFVCLGSMFDFLWLVLSWGQGGGVGGQEVID